MPSSTSTRRPSNVTLNGRNGVERAMSFFRSCRNGSCPPSRCRRSCIGGGPQGWRGMSGFRDWKGDGKVRAQATDRDMVEIRLWCAGGWFLCPAVVIYPSSTDLGHIEVAGMGLALAYTPSVTRSENVSNAKPPIRPISLSTQWPG